MRAAGDSLLQGTLEESQGDTRGQTMASLLVSNSLSLTLTQSLPFTFPARASFRPPPSPPIHFASNSCCRKPRGLTVVTRAGPSTSSYVFAFALPLSLLAITILVSLRIGERLDREFLEEVMGNICVWTWILVLLHLFLISCSWVIEFFCVGL